jgi:iron-only hydrogenase group A
MFNNNSIEFDENKCIKCSKCVLKCNSASVGYLEMKTDPENKKHLSKKNNLKCIACGQCTLVCPVKAVKLKSSINAVKKVLKDKSKVVIVQAAPSIRSVINEAWNIEKNIDIEKKMNTAFRMLGFSKVFDINFGADITTIIEAKELIERLNNSKAVLPMFTSCCPAWVNYVTEYQPELIPNLTTARSPHLHSGGAYKTWWAEKENINPNNIIVVSIMPCTAKKEEIMRATNNINGLKMVDYVLTIRELIEMIKENNIDFANLENSEADFLSLYSGASAIYGASGGVMESALRTGYKMITGNDLGNLDLEQVRTDVCGFKTAKIDINGTKLKVAIVSTIQNVKKILEELKDNPKAYHYIEVMNCAGGCINGGGMPLSVIKPVEQLSLINARRKVLYDIDKSKKIRVAHNNELVNEFMDWVEKQKDAHLEHTLYHTNFN